MKFNEITENASAGSTGSGSISTVASPMSMQSRNNASIYGGKKAGNLLTGKKSKGKYANSVEARKHMNKVNEANVIEDEKNRRKNIKSGHNPKVKQLLRDEGTKIIQQWVKNLHAQFPKMPKNRGPSEEFPYGPISIVKSAMKNGIETTARLIGERNINRNGIENLKTRHAYDNIIIPASQEILLNLLPQIDFDKIKSAYNNPKILDTELTEEDVMEKEVLVIPGSKKKDRRSGFVPHGESRVDHEVKMAKADLFATAKNAKEIMECLKDRSEEEGIKGWMQSYITLANDYLNSVNESLQYEMQMHEDQPAAYGNGADDRINTRNKLDKEPYGGPSSSSPGGALQSTVGGA